MKKLQLSTSVWLFKHNHVFKNSRNPPDSYIGWNPQDDPFSALNIVLLPYFRLYFFFSYSITQGLNSQ